MKDVFALPRPPVPEPLFTAEQVAQFPDPDQRDVLVADARPRPARDPEVREVTTYDAVFD